MRISLYNAVGLDAVEALTGSCANSSAPARDPGARYHPRAFNRRWLIGGMMNLYSNVLFVHIVSALGLFLGYGLEWT